MIEATATTQSGLLVASTLEGVAQLHHHRPDGSGGDAIDFGEPGSLLGLDGSDDREEAFACFTSFARPPALQRWTPADGLVPWSDLPGAADPDHYVVERTSYLSTDGVEIGLFLIRSADLVPGPKTPTVLTGYGGFAVTMAPAWRPRRWRSATKAACMPSPDCEAGPSGARTGIGRACGRTSSRSSTTSSPPPTGWSTGVHHPGAAGRPGRQQRRAARSRGDHPATRSVRRRPLRGPADRHGSLPLLLAELWVPEYGDPRVEQELAWLLAYSPYHHVLDGACYPAVLFTTAEQDSRVDPAHARKMAARLQEATECGDRRPIPLREEHEAGHGQGKPVSMQAHELTDVLSFLLWQLHTEDGAEEE